MPPGDRSLSPSRGFTLIELLVVLAVLAVLAGMVVPSYLQRATDARETMLKYNLGGLRKAIDDYYRDKGKYPPSLQDLVDQRYLRSIPVDPITNRADTWVIVPPREGEKNAVFDVKSGATGQASNGSPFVTW